MKEVHTSNMQQPPRVLLYSGHMIDAPGREYPRFRPSLESTVSAAIDKEIDHLNLGEGDLAIGSASCGTDILTAESVLRRNIELRLFLPFHTDDFIKASVAFADKDWKERFTAITSQAKVRTAKNTPASRPPGESPFEQTNLWMLEEAALFSKGNIVLLCVWDGQGGDGPGGTQHMVECVERLGGEILWIDIRKLKNG